MKKRCPRLLPSVLFLASLAIGALHGCQSEPANSGDPRTGAVKYDDFKRQQRENDWRKSNRREP